MIYGSVCSGIEAATVAWHPLGWRAAWYAEIDKFASAVLAHRYPEVRNFGDFTQIDAATAGAVDVLVGGTPCHYAERRIMPHRTERDQSDDGFRRYFAVPHAA